MTVGEIGTLISVLTGLLFLLVSLAGWRSRRASREARELRQVKEINIAAMEWVYATRLSAAAHGWKLPAVPKELTVEYLQGKAEGEDNVELAQLAKQMRDLARGDREEK
jgi:hypothetical protein